MLTFFLTVCGGIVKKKSMEMCVLEYKTQFWTKVNAVSASSVSLCVFELKLNPCPPQRGFEGDVCFLGDAFNRRVL